MNRLSLNPTTSLVLIPEKSRKDRRKKLTGDDRFKPKGSKRQLPKRRPKPFGKHNKDRYHK